jgi:hypothetical protein
MNKYKLTVRYNDLTDEYGVTDTIVFKTYDGALDEAEALVGTSCHVHEDDIVHGLLATIRGTVGGQPFGLATIEVCP